MSLPVEISSDLNLKVGRVPMSSGWGTVTLDRDVPLELGATVRGTVAFAHQEDSDDGRPIKFAASGTFSARLCEDRPGALAELARRRVHREALSLDRRQLARQNLPSSSAWRASCGCDGSTSPA